MKKQLMASTALVAAGLLAAAAPAEAQQKKASLSLGGYTIASVSFTDEDGSSADQVNFDVKADGEVFFSGRLALDNGMTITSRVELEQETQTDQIDEAFIQIRGSFGMIELGGNDSVGESMTTGYNGAWAVNVARGIDFDINNYFQRPAGHTRITNSRGGGITGDSTKISYYTPRFAGFQVGASYTPAMSDDGAATQNAINTEAGGLHDGMTIAANYDQKWGDVRVGIAGSYETAKAASGSGAPDPDEWNIAALVEFGPVRLSASRTEYNDGGDGVIYQVGGRYTFGPNAVSLAYMNQNAEGTPGGDEDTSDIIIAGYSRAIAPGAKWMATFYYADYEDEGGADTKSWAIDLGISIAF
jgi:hypothetical protein